MNSLTSAVAAVIRDSSGRVLLCQQNQGHRLWGLPGGKIRNAESPVHAVTRDVREETGMEIQPTDLVGIYHLTGDSCGDDLPDVLVHVFRAKIVNGEALVNSPSWIRRLTWADPDDLPSPLTATTRVAVADAVQGVAGALRDVERAAEPVVPDASDDMVGEAAVG
ncbi:MAG: NUDIX hydrolase [Micromonosporaceae bacterium]